MSNLFTSSCTLYSDVATADKHQVKRNMYIYFIQLSLRNNRPTAPTAQSCIMHFIMQADVSFFAISTANLNAALLFYKSD